LASLSDAHGYSLLWGGSLQEGSRRGSEIERLARHYVDSGVAGVYFAPIESCPEYAAINKNAISILETAKVPLVLLDSDYLAFPERSAFDLVGIDHLRAGYEATAHLLSHGTRRVDFIKSPDSGAAVALRVRGYREALLDAGIAPRQEWVHEGNPDAHHFIQALLAIPDLSDIVCQNDEMAAALMKALEAFQVAIPDRLRLVGFDDVKYARHLRVPLTTIRQPCEEIAACAVELMVARIGDPLLPVKSLYLKSHLVERASSGSA
jgi:DNA-binding LacI/PurR family transcriptional regulator